MLAKAPKEKKALVSETPSPQNNIGRCINPNGKECNKIPKGGWGTVSHGPHEGGPTEDTDETEHGIDRETLRRRVHGGDVRYNQISRPENGPIYRAEVVKSFTRQPAP